MIIMSHDEETNARGKVSDDTAIDTSSKFRFHLKALQSRLELLERRRLAGCQ